MFKYEVLILGELQTNCYLLWDDQTKEAVIIDGADDGVAISEEIEKLGLKPKYILATHGHFDHNLGALDIKLIYKIPYCASEKDMFLLKRQQETAIFFLKKDIKVPNIMKIDIDLDKEKEIKLGEGVIKILKCPGHTPGGLAFLADNFLFSGDTVFADGMLGRTDFEYSRIDDLNKSIKEILNLPKDTIILSGHGEATTAAETKQYFMADE
jgi:glyoxylase-like metal-dependent hydrolase (beta-lactamase superfamily II)